MSDKPTAPSHSYITTSTALVLCSITLALALVLPGQLARLGVPFFSQASQPASVGQGAKIVVLDMDKVFAAGVRHTQAAGGSPEQIQAATERIQTVVRRYAGAGYLVLNNRALIEDVPGLDITEQVIGELGFK